MSCSDNHINEQKALAQADLPSRSSSLPATKLYLYQGSQGDQKSIVISAFTNGPKTDYKIPLKLRNSGNFGQFQLSYKGPNFYNYFPPNATITVSKMLLKNSTTRKDKFSLEELRNGEWKLLHIDTKIKTDCTYLFTRAIKDKNTVILTVLFEIVDENNSSQEFALYLNGIDNSLLHRAVIKKDIKTIELLLKCNLNINARNENDWTPLHVAIDLEASDMVDCLIKNGADVNARNKTDQVPLHHAVKIDNPAILDSLLNNPATELDMIDEDGRTPLFYAVTARNLPAVNLLLQKGVNHKLTDSFDYTAFHSAVNPANLDLIKIFLDNNVNVEILNKRGQTPLFFLSSKPRSSKVDINYKEAYVEIINAFIDKGANINYRDLVGRTPLYVAVMNNNIKCARALLKCEADATIPTYLERSILHVACQNSKNKCIPILLTTDVDINAVDGDGITALHVAVEANNYDAAVSLLRNGANIDISDREGKTALHLALESQNLPIIDLLLNNKADVNVKDQQGKTALHVALQNRKITIKIIKSILDSTSDINAVDDEQKTALHVAVEEDNYQALKLILEKRPNINMTDKLNRTPLYRALESTCLPVIELLLKNNADVNVRDNNERTALHLAAENPNIPISIFKFIWNASDDVNARNNCGSTALHFAAYNHNFDVINFLIEQNVDVNTRDYQNRIALHLTVYPGNNFNTCFKCVKILLDNKSEVNVNDKDLITPLHWAAFSKNEKVIKYLLKHGADTSKRDMYGRTVIHYASIFEINKQSTKIHDNVEEHVKETLNLIIEEGVSVNSVDGFLRTPLHYITECDKYPFMHQQFLNIGADINLEDYNGYSPFDNLMNQGTHIFDGPQGLFTIYSKHVIKMKAMNMWVQQLTLETVYGMDDEECVNWIEFHEKPCLEEVNRMKATYLDHDITYYDFLRKSEHNAINLAQNLNIVRAIKSDRLVNEFPIYEKFFKCHLREIQQRSSSYEKLQESLKPYFSGEIYTIFMGEIVRYLNNFELAMILEAFDQ